jgi:tripartite-type tricarboxylate transporter receptor subunit TctC
MGLDMVHVPFKGAGPAHQEMFGGRVDVMFDNISASKGYVQANRLKGLAVSSLARNPQMPNLPTINETGVVKFDGESWFGIFAPAGTPPAIVGKLREVLATINKEPDFVARVDRDGGRILNISPNQQQAFLKEEVERWVGSVARYKVTAD